MKLHADSAHVSSVQAQGPGWISVGGQTYTHSLILTASGQPAPWSCDRLEELTPSHFERLLDFQPELVIFGSGQRLRFVHPSLHAALIQQRVGMETMDTMAACRTFNVLAQEGRRVVAALLLEDGHS